MERERSHLVPSLPQCVATALARAEDLFAVIMETPFPNLDMEDPEESTALDTVVAALAWADKIDTFHGAVVDLFPPHENGIAVEIPLPPSRFLGGHPTLLGGGYKRGYTPEPFQGSAFGDIIYRDRRMDVASDVLEPVPPRYRDSMAGSFPFSPGRVHAEFNPDWIAKVVTKELNRCFLQDGWPSVRQRLLEGRMIVRAKSLGLVAWVRERSRELQAATLPAITWERSRTYDGQIVRASLAGASREVVLTRSEHDFLNGLAGGMADASRTTKSDLAKKLPELDPYIACLGPASRKTSRYSIPAELAARIRVAPNTPATSPTATKGRKKAHHKRLRPHEGA